MSKLQCALCAQQLPPALAAFNRLPQRQRWRLPRAGWCRSRTNWPKRCLTPAAGKAAGTLGARSWPSSPWPSCVGSKWASGKSPDLPANSLTPSAAPWAAVATRTLRHYVVPSESTFQRALAMS